MFSCTHPIRTTLWLLWPFPSWKLPIPPQLSIEQLLSDRDQLETRKWTEINYTPLRQLHLFIARDTPLRSLYRLYECVVCDDENEMMQECNYFFHTQPHWRVCDIPNPNDDEPRVQAILAALVEALVDAYNWKIKLGLRRGVTHHLENALLISEFRKEPNPPLEHVPSWCADVGALPTTLYLVPGDITGRTDRETGFFTKRNIVASIIQLYNI